MAAYAVGDIHGCVHTLRHLIEGCIAPAKDDVIFFLGDYVNKGPDPKGVIDYVLALREDGYTIQCLRGNHEQYLLDALRYPWEGSPAGQVGTSTLTSFGVRFVRDIPHEYIQFMAETSYFYETACCILVHAGFNFDLDDPYRDDFAMLNIKSMDVDQAKTGGKIIVHGHVPTPLAYVQAQAGDASSASICIDAGCVYTDRPGMSHLVAMDLDTRKLYVTKNRE